MNQIKFSEKKINIIIQRLILLRNCFVNFFFENKIEKIESVVSKELDIINYSKIKQKSTVKNMITEYNFINKKNEFEIKNKNISRNQNINAKSFNSDNQKETSIKKNEISKKSNSFSLNAQTILNSIF